MNVETWTETTNGIPWHKVSSRRGGVVNDCTCPSRGESPHDIDCSAERPQGEERQRRRRFRECAEQFGSEGEYNPRCCRFPKSCSPYPYQEAIDAGNVADDDLEPLR